MAMNLRLRTDTSRDHPVACEGVKKKILLVDDDKDMLCLYKGILSGKGYDVITAVNGKEGFEKNEYINPDLILLDLRMPEMGGIETLRNIRRVDTSVKVIVLTAGGSADSARTASSLNAFSYTCKSAGIKHISAIVEEALSEGYDEKGCRAEKTNLCACPQYRA